MSPHPSVEQLREVDLFEGLSDEHLERCRRERVDF